MNFDKAKDLAAQATQKATEVAGELAEKVAPYAEKAGEAAAKGVNVAADAANKATGGRYEEQIKGVTEKVEGAINKSKPDNTGK
ncbi:MAG: Rv0909 family putative TA system antitoxin [Haloechinothrix sp.]